jgi:hypothetical protein
MLDGICISIERQSKSLFSGIINHDGFSSALKLLQLHAINGLSVKNYFLQK